MIQFLLADVVVVLIVVTIFAIFCLLCGAYLSTRRNRRNDEKLRQAVAKSGQDLSGSLANLLSMYITIVSKHGPSSEEANAFRFGLDSKLVSEVHQESIGALMDNMSIVDRTYKSMKTR